MTAAPSWRGRARRRIRHLARRWSSSLAVRVAAMVLVAGALALSAIAAFVSTSIRDGLFDARVEQIQSDALWRANQAQSTLDAANVQSTAQVQRLVYDLIYEQRVSAPGTVGVLLLPEAEDDPTPGAGYFVTDRDLVDLVTDQMRAALAGGADQYWQSVRVDTSAGQVPGVIVGKRITVPLAGGYDYFMVYSLAAEQRSINLVMRVLAIGVFGLVAILALITWAVTWQILRPVRQAALSAERIAAGVLTERMPVRGEDELATLGRSFNMMAASLQDQIKRLEELSRVQRRFVSDVSHELRTPLTTIRMAAEMIYAAKDDFDAGTRRSAELLYIQLDRFETMLADLLEISRFDAGAAVLDAEEHDLRSVLSRVTDMAAPLAAARGVELRLHGMAQSATARIDPRRIERVVRNLVINAIEHSENAPVDLTLAASADAVAVRVLDHGIGMDADAAAHVFDRFWRADPSRARTIGGSGLGLAISLEDARLHGGDLTAWGEPGVGASFLLTLPREPDNAPGPSPLPIHPLAARVQS